MYQNRKFLKWDENNPNPLTQKQWNGLFTNLYKNTKQKDSFDVRYRFLHLGLPTAIKLNEIRQGDTDTTCPRCGEQEETHEHWMFSCPSSQNILKYIQPILNRIYTNYAIRNIATDCLLKPLLTDNEKYPVVLELYETYFIQIRNIRKDATCGTPPTRNSQLISYQEKVKDRLNFLYNAADIEGKLELFLKKWKGLITREGNIDLPPISNE